MTFLRFTLFLAVFIFQDARSQQPFSVLTHSKIYLVSVKNSKGMSLPDHFEENISEKAILEKQDSIREIAFITYTERSKTIGNFIRKESKQFDQIHHWINDEVWHNIDRDKESQNGVLCGKKGKINRLLIKSTIPGIPATEQYNFENDTTCFIIYRPELHVIELESYGTKQRRYLIGHLYENMTGETGKPLNRRINKTFRTGDRMQILYTIENPDSGGKSLLIRPNQVLEYEITKTFNEFGTDQASYRTWIRDIKTGIRERLGDNLISIFEDGIMLGDQMAVGDTTLKCLLRVIPENSLTYTHPLFPLMEIYGPAFESFWTEVDTLNGLPIQTNSYWTSLYNGRINWMEEFPIIWSDNGESIRGSVIYYSKSGHDVGTPYQIKENPLTHITEISLLDSELQLSVFSNNNQTISLSIFSASGELIPIKNSKLEIKKGTSENARKIPGIQAGASYVVKLHSTNKKAELIQEYRIVSRSNP